jgi:predicted exporter
MLNVVILNSSLARFFSAWLLLVIATGVSLLWQWQHGIVIESNVLKLLPATEQDAVVQKAVERFGDSLAKKHLLLVGANSAKQAKNAAQFLFKGLEKSAVFPSIDFKVSRDQREALFRIYNHYQSSLLSRTAIEQLERSDVSGLFNSAVKSLYSPLTPVNSDILARDPLLLLYDYLTELPVGQTGVQLDGDYLLAHTDEGYFVLLSLQLPGDAYSLTVQQQVVPLLDNQIRQLKTKFPTSDVVSVGVVRYAYAGVESARSEISTIGVGSLIGVIVLLAMVFRSALPILVSLIPILIGFVAALSACLWVFGSVHVLTLVFGASLIGISIDYSFHFFADRLAAGKHWRSAEGVQRIFGGISLGLITSIIGFVGLCIAPFPGMQQMALFSSVGLLTAYLTVVGLFPVLVQKAPSVVAGQSQWVERIGRLLSCWSRVYRRLPAWVWLVGMGLFIALGVGRLTTNDDVRVLQSVPPELASEEQRLKRITGNHPASQFFLIEGLTEQAVLDQEQQLIGELRQLQEASALTGFNAISNYLPSQQRQISNYLMVKEQLIEQGGALEQYQQLTGLDTALIDGFRSRYSSDQPEILQLDTFWDSSAADAFRHLWLGETPRGFASMIMLQGLSDLKAVKVLENRWPNVHFIDQVDDISSLFRQYRERAGILVLLAYGVIYFLLLLRYGVRRASIIMLAPVAAAALTIAILALIGEALNIFHSLALLLVLGIGIDYTLFLEEGSAHSHATMLAIVLSAMTTILSFGLLALSQTAAIHAFGVTVLIGITGALVFSPLVIEFSNSRGNPIQG